MLLWLYLKKYEYRKTKNVNTKLYKFIQEFSWEMYT